MDIKTVFLHSLKFERRLTRETITAMTDGDMAFAAAEGQMGFGAQALHVISCQETLLEAMKHGTWNWERGINLEQFPTQEAILAKFDELQATELAYYGGLEPEEFSRPVATAWGPPEPLFQLALSFLTHEAHHRGQMIVFLRLKGMQAPKY